MLRNSSRLAVASAVVMTLVLLLTMARPIAGAAGVSFNSADRTIEIDGGITRVTIDIEVANDGPSAQQHVFLAVPASQAKQLSWLSVEGETEDKELHVEPSTFPGARKGDRIFKVTLEDKLASGDTTFLKAVQVMTHSMYPLPRQIRQGEDQLVVYEDSAFVYSVYSIASQSTLFKLPGAIESASEFAPMASEPLRYGEYEDIAAFTTAEISVHFENPRPFMTFEQVKRTIEVSHWGNLAIDEYHHLKHDGAELVGGFSRHDYQRRPAPGSYRAVKAFLPLHASGVYYRDVIGNISTSHIRPAREYQVVELEPRFPMMGGWQTQYLFGYNLPLADHLAWTSAGKRLLTLPVSIEFEGFALDDLEVRILLPEGASDIKVHTPYPMDQAMETTTSYLDWAGRPTIVLRKSNTVEDHNLAVQIEYSFSSTTLLREPLTLVMYVFLFCLAVIVAVRVDLDITSGRTKEEKAALARLSGVLMRVKANYTQRLALYQQLTDALDKFLKSKNMAQYKTEEKALKSALVASIAELSQIAQDLQSSGEGATSAHVEELAALERAKQQAVAQQHQQVKMYAENKATKAVHAEAITRLNAAVDRATAEVVAAVNSLCGHL